MLTNFRSFALLCALFTFASPAIAANQSTLPAKSLGEILHLRAPAESCIPYHCAILGRAGYSMSWCRAGFFYKSVTCNGHTYDLKCCRE